MSWLGDETEGVAAASARALNAAFQPNADRYVRVSYTIELVVGAAQSAIVDLKCDANPAPATIQTSARLDVAAAGVQTTVRQQLTLVVPPGYYVELVSSGAGAASIVHQTETPVG